MKRSNEGFKVKLGKQRHHFSKKKFNKQLISVCSTALLLFSNYGLFPLQVLAEEQAPLDMENVEPQLDTLTDELPVQPAITSEAPIRSITYYSNDGTDQSEISEETAQAKPAEDMIREGYTFQAWNTQADGQGVNYLPEEALPEEVTELYAVWEQLVVESPAEPNGQAASSEKDAQANSDSQPALYNQIGTRAGEGTSPDDPIVVSDYFWSTQVGKFYKVVDGGDVGTVVAGSTVVEVSGGTVWDNMGEISTVSGGSVFSNLFDGTIGEVRDTGFVSSNGGTIREVSGGTVTNNELKGKIGTVSGTGFVETNFGTISEVSGNAEVEYNEGTISTVRGGTVTINRSDGTIGEVSDSGSVENNSGTISTVSVGTVTINLSYGTIGEVIGTGFVTSNDGTISTVSGGTVRSNNHFATIGEVTGTGCVDSNIGTITTLNGGLIKSHWLNGSITNMTNGLVLNYGGVVPGTHGGSVIEISDLQTLIDSQNDESYVYDGNTKFANLTTHADFKEEWKNYVTIYYGDSESQVPLADAGDHLITAKITYNGETIETLLKDGTFKITPKEISIDSLSVESKEYDGKVAATLQSAVFDGVIPTDTNDVSLDLTNTTAAFEDKKIGDNKKIILSNVQLTGSKAGNYSIASTDNVPSNGNITHKILTSDDIAFNGTTKPFDGTKDISLTAAVKDTAVQLNDNNKKDEVSITVESSRFTNSSIGTNIPIECSWSLDGADANNYKLPDKPEVKGSITAPEVTPEIQAEIIKDIKNTNPEKTYNGLATDSFNLDITKYFTSEVTPGESIILKVEGSYADKRAGSVKDFTVTNWTVKDGKATIGEIPNDLTTTGTIHKRELAVTWKPVRRPYDGTTNATLKGEITSGLVEKDVVEVTGIGQFAQKDVGTNIEINGVAPSVAGTHGGNYTVKAPTTHKGSITKLTIRSENWIAEDKVYDGKTTAKVTGKLVGVLLNEDVTIEGTGTFDSKNASEVPINVTIGGIKLGGTAAKNYKLDSTKAQTTAKITQKPVTAEWTMAEKIYDGDLSATVTGKLNGVIDDDKEKVTVSASATFDNAQAGKDKTLHITSITLGGLEASNYLIDSSEDIKETIKARELQVEFNNLDKVYDKLKDSPLQATIKDRENAVVPGDDVSVKIDSAQFDNEQAGPVKNISYSWKLEGDHASNYSLPEQLVKVQGAITPKPLTATWTAENRTYDGTKDASVKGTLAGVESKDTVTITGIGAFATKDVEADKEVTIEDIQLDGTDSGNYTVTDAAATTKATISAYQISADQVTFGNLNKAFDNTNDASQVTAALPKAAPFSGDDVGIDLSEATYTDPNIGTGIDIKYKWALAGNDAKNYKLPDENKPVKGAITNPDFTSKTLTDRIKKVAPTKVYDGQESYEFTINITELAKKKTRTATKIELKVTGHFDQKTVDAQTFTVTGWEIVGGNATIPAFGETIELKGSITKRDVTAKWDKPTKTYNGKTEVAVTGTLNGLVSNEKLTVTSTANFKDANVGAGKDIKIKDVTLVGDTAPNYKIDQTGSTTGTIEVYELQAEQVVFSKQNKEYDKTKVSLLEATFKENVLFGKDKVAIEISKAEFADDQAGPGKAISYKWKLTGEQSGNYKLLDEVDVKGEITKKALTAKWNQPTKTYDGLRAAAVTGELQGVIPKDVVDVAFDDANFKDANAGETKQVDISNIRLTGKDAGNYSIPDKDTTTGIINPFVLQEDQIQFIEHNKVYDKEVDSRLKATIKDDVLVPSDKDKVAIEISKAEFADDQAGPGKAISYKWELTGEQSGNYKLLEEVDVKGEITKKAITAKWNQPTKTYDGLRAATVIGELQGVIPKDVVDVAFDDANFKDANAGETKQVDISNIRLTGTDAGNYSIVEDADTTGTINKKDLKVTWSVADKVYDGTTKATVTGALEGMIPGEETAVSISGTGEFTDKNVAGSIPVTITDSKLAGDGAKNYGVTETVDATAKITAYQITEDQITFENLNKPFDTTDSAAQLTAILPNEAPFATDDLSVALKDAVYAQSDIGEDIGISYEWELAGKDAQNYRLPEDKIDLQGNITEAVMTEAAVIERIKQVTPTKVYDRNTDHTFNVNITEAAQRKTRDATQILLEVTGEFVQASAGEQVFNVTSWRVTSGNATLPALTKPFQVTGEIQPRAITVNWSAADKEYDGSLDTPLTAVCEDILPDDEVTFAATGTYDDKNCGSHEVRLDAASVQLSGAHAGNYIVETQNDTCNIEITPRPVTVEWQVADKVYDAKPDATVTGTLNNLVPDDEVMVATTAQFVDKNVGDNKPVHVNTPTFSGADHQNYTITAPAEAAATISPYNIQLDQISFGQTVKAFDQSAAAKLTARLIGLPLELDDLRIDITDARYPDSDIGENKAISYDWKLAGADEANYRLPEKPSVTGAIANPTVDDDTQARIIELLKQQTPEKVYDGNSVHQFELDITSAFGEPTRRAATPTQILLNVTGTFEQSDAGDQRFNVMDWNITSNNAVIGELPAGIVLEGSITKRAATIHWTAADKVYDGTTAATVQATVDGLVTGDQVTVTGVGDFVDKNAGAHKAVTITSTEVTGDAAVNYEFATPDIGITANIQQKAVTISGVKAVNRRANDSRLVELLGTDASLAGVLPGDQNAVGFNLGQGTMADAAAGKGKAVTTNIQLTGEEAGNYILTQPTDLTVDITKKKVTVTIVDENGNKQEVELEEGAKLPRPKDPVKDGFTFEGWYVDEALTQPFDFDQPITGNVTLYPKWSRNVPTATTTNRNIVTPRVVTSSGNTTTSSSGKSLPSTGDSLNNMWSMLGLGAIASAIAAWKKRKG